MLEEAVLEAGLTFFLFLTAGVAVAVAVAPVRELSGANVMGLNTKSVSMTMG